MWRVLVPMAWVFCNQAVAQNYPVKPIRLVVGFTPGGVADAVARQLARKMNEPLGQQIVVEYRGGASGAIANEMVARQPPDGYMLLIIGASAAAIPAMRANVPYDLARDFTAISLVALAPFALVVHPSMPVKNAKELIALARSRPGKVNFGSVGVGSTPHLMAGQFLTMAKLDVVHVPYKGGSEHAVSLVSGQIDMSFMSLPTITPLKGRVKPIAVTTLKRAAFMPDVPTLDESGLPGYDAANWNGVVGPAGLPKDIVARLNGIMVKMADAQDVKDAYAQQGMLPLSSTPEHFAHFIREEVAKTARLVRQIGIKSE
jgi:tripartite-type tricarboxylate transporter receptor subunit TctC